MSTKTYTRQLCQIVVYKTCRVFLFVCLFLQILDLKIIFRSWLIDIFVHLYLTGAQWVIQKKKPLVLISNCVFCLFVYLFFQKVFSRHIQVNAYTHMHLHSCKEINLAMSHCEGERGKGRVVIMWQGVCCTSFLLCQDQHASYRFAERRRVLWVIIGR